MICNGGQPVHLVVAEERAGNASKAISVSISALDFLSARNWRNESFELGARRLENSRGPIGPVEAILGDGQAEWVQQIGRHRSDRAVVRVDAFDFLCAGVSEAQFTGGLGKGQRIWQLDSRSREKNFPFGTIQVRPFDFGSVTIPISPEKLAEMIQNGKHEVSFRENSVSFLDILL